MLIPYWPKVIGYLFCEVINLENLPFIGGIDQWRTMVVEIISLVNEW